MPLQRQRRSHTLKLDMLSHGWKRPLPREIAGKPRKDEAASEGISVVLLFAIIYWPSGVSNATSSLTSPHQYEVRRGTC